MREAALAVAALFEELGLRPWAMTSGSRGYHVVLSLARRAEYPAMREFARDFATLAERRHRELFTTEQRKAKREGKILLDVGRNNFGTTSVAPYSVRARPNAPVATPLELGELSDSATLPQRWTISNIRGRLDKDGDPWRDIAKHAQSLSTARGKLDAALSET